MWVQSPPPLCTFFEWRVQVFILFLVSSGVPSSLTLPCIRGARAASFLLVLDGQLAPLLAFAFINKPFGPLRVFRADLESPARNLRTRDNRAVMPISWGNTVLLLCFTVLFICPQPANRVSSGNTARHSSSFGVTRTEWQWRGWKGQPGFCGWSTLFTGSGGLF